ncbi:MAG: glucosaminidase domain-containing protein, partial [Chitinophagaceae bacterium]
KDYIQKFKDIAMSEMMRTGVPASITLAQGIHETEAGRSKLVLMSNNHFGIKCKADWKGESVSHDDDAQGECFRKYADPADSYKDHSDFLKTRAHYASLFQLDPVDFESWAHGLKKAGYATNPKYPQILIRLIKDYKLHDYTLIALGRKVEDESTKDVAAISSGPAVQQSVGEAFKEKVEEKRYPQGQFHINRTPVVFVPKGTSYLALAREHNIPLRRIFEFNDMVEAEETIANRLVYLQRKRREGATDFHLVLTGETLYDIAQLEGIQLESLISYNYLRSDVAPSPGRKLNLKKGGPEQAFVPVALPQSETNDRSSNRDKRIAHHVVKAKESLYGIAKLYAVTIEELREWNKLESNDLQTGQQIRINKK